MNLEELCLVQLQVNKWAVLKTYLNCIGKGGVFNLLYFGTSKCEEFFNCCFLPDYRALIKFNIVPKQTNKKTEVHTCLKFCQKLTDIKGICDVNSNLPSSTT